eukprot:4689-Heterococcus_DN1.PRE.2
MREPGPQCFKETEESYLHCSSQQSVCSAAATTSTATAAAIAGSAATAATATATATTVYTITAARRPAKTAVQHNNSIRT